MLKIGGADVKTASRPGAVAGGVLGAVRHPGVVPAVPQPALRLEGVVKRYGPVTAVAGLDLVLPEATCVGLLGPNGAGKSTTMKLLTAQAIADEG